MSKKKNKYSKFWSPNHILGRNAVFNYVVGGRGTGKTYRCKWWLIKRAIKTRRPFIYLRRYETEFEDKGKFFSDVLDRFPQFEFKIEGMTAYARRKQTEEEAREHENDYFEIVYFAALSKALIKKSVPYNLVDYIVFDEFIIDRKKMHYLPNEATAFLDFYNTVDRFQDRVKVLFLANAVALVNPYFVYFNLSPRRGKEFTLSPDGFHCVEIVSAQQYKEYVNSTRFGQMIANTEYYDYAVDNRFFDQHDRFIEKKPENAEYVYAITFDGVTYAVWADYGRGRYYINDKVPNGRLPFILTRDDMQPNLLMIEKASFLLKSLKALYMQSSIYYESIELREQFNEVMEYLGVR